MNGDIFSAHGESSSASDDHGSMQSPARILVVDDEPGIRQLLSELLRSDQHFVEVAIDGVDALNKFTSDSWDSVLTDRAMPRMDGETLAAKIKELAPEMPIIMVTGFVSALQHPQSIDVVIEKPFTRALVRRAISAALEFKTKRKAHLQPVYLRAADVAAAA